MFINWSSKHSLGVAHPYVNVRGIPPNLAFLRGNRDNYLRFRQSHHGQSHFLNQLPGIVKPGGQLVIASPFSWLDQYTPKRQWLGTDDLRYQLVVSQVLTFVRKGS